MHLTGRHGIKQYPLGDATVDLICEERTDAAAAPVIHLNSDRPVTLRVYCNGIETVYENKYVL